MISALTNLIMVIIFHYLHVWNHHTVYLKGTQVIYQLYLSKNWKKINFFLFQSQRKQRSDHVWAVKEGILGWSHKTHLLYVLTWVAFTLNLCGTKRSPIFLVLFSKVIMSVCLDGWMDICIFLLVFSLPALHFKLQEVRNISALLPVVLSSV